MKLLVKPEEKEAEKRDGCAFTRLLTQENGCTSGCMSGIAVYTKDEYIPGGVHKDQEGFYVLEGTGTARVGEEELPLSPGFSFYVPPGVYHTVKRDSSCSAIKLFLFHAAV